MLIYTNLSLKNQQAFRQTAKRSCNPTRLGFCGNGSFVQNLKLPRQLPSQALTVSGFEFYICTHNSCIFVK